MTKIMLLQNRVNQKLRNDRDLKKTEELCLMLHLLRLLGKSISTSDRVIRFLLTGKNKPQKEQLILLQ